MKTKTKTKTKQDLNYWMILLYIPNLIGHARAILLIGFVVCDTIDVNPWICCGMLATSIFLDTIDGVAARKFNQCTRFGYLYDIFLDCMTPIVVYGQCRQNNNNDNNNNKNPLCLKIFSGLFVFVCTAWCLLAMSTTSWKIDRPKYWPASAVTTSDGQFTSFGTILWYFGFAGNCNIIYALDRELLDIGSPFVVMILIFGLLDILSFMEYNRLYIKSLLENEIIERKAK